MEHDDLGSSGGVYKDGGWFCRLYPDPADQVHGSPLARLAEDQPLTCTCSVTGPRTCPRHRAHYDDPFPAAGAGDLVPGYADSADGRADARDQARMDAR